MREPICTVCPKGCRPPVEEQKGVAVTGNGCPRRAEYGKMEPIHPARRLGQRPS